MFKRTEGSKQYDLEERTLQFAKDIRVFVKMLPRTIANLQDIRQLVRASGSVGANYIEANESLSKKDFVMRIKISRKEAKEVGTGFGCSTQGRMIQFGQDSGRTDPVEATELMNIFGAIVRKSE